MRFLDGLDADTQSMFTGQRRSVLHCTACMHTTDKVETFMHVTVSVCPRLEDSIKDFCGQEILDAPSLTCCTCYTYQRNWLDVVTLDTNGCSYAVRSCHLQAAIRVASVLNGVCLERLQTLSAADHYLRPDGPPLTLLLVGATQHAACASGLREGDGGGREI